MVLLNLVLCVLVLPLCLANCSPNPLQSFDIVDSGRRYLPGNSANICTNPEELYYNMFFTVIDPSKLATAQCTEDSYIDMGLLIQDIVAQTDKNFPQYRNEFIDSSVCAVPSWSFGEATDGKGRALIEKLGNWVHRRLSTYTYTAGGRCRRCTSGRRQLDEESDEGQKFPPSRRPTFPPTPRPTNRPTPPSRTPPTSPAVSPFLQLLRWPSPTLPPTISPTPPPTTPPTPPPIIPPTRPPTMPPTPLPTIFPTYLAPKLTPTASLTGLPTTTPMTTTTPSASEAADVACNMASTAEFAVSVCTMGHQHCQVTLEEIAALAAVHLQAHEGANYTTEAQEKCDLVSISLISARSASTTADSACALAQEKATLGDESSVLTAMLEADAATDIAVGNAMLVQSACAEQNQVKYELMRKIMEADFQVRDAKLNELISEEKKKYEEAIREIEAKVSEIEMKLQQQPSIEQVESLTNSTEILEAELERARRKHAEVTKAANDWVEEVTDAHAFGKKMDEYNYALSTAPTLDAWLEKYRMLLQDVIPKYLFDVFNTTGGGCLDPLYEDNFNVTVEIVEVASKNETFSDRCKSPDFVG